MQAGTRTNLPTPDKCKGRALDRLPEGDVRGRLRNVPVRYQEGYRCTGWRVQVKNPPRRRTPPTTSAGSPATMLTLIRWMGRYYSRVRQVHGACFYDGIRHDQTERLIRGTSVYICDAEQLA